ncbi:MAG TPA: ATP-binding protein [Flavipsychrobacter sp.]|nr:ATP-binding protein [Flavipsychrobacter sp.]
MLRHKLYVPNLILIVICLIVLVAIYLLNAIGNSKNDKSPLVLLQGQDSTIHYLQDSKDDLYWAENAYHYYLGTHDSAYKAKFISYLESFVSNLENSHILDDSSSNDIAINLQQKVYLANAVIRLKQFADNLLSTSLRDSVFDADEYINIGPASRVVQRYLIQKNDTVRYVPVKRRKTLINKIVSIFKDDQDSLSAVISGGSKTLSFSDSSKMASQAQKRKLRSIDKSLQKHYHAILKKELDVRKSIDEKNRQEALFNQAIFTDIQNEITKVLKSANNTRQKGTYNTISKLHNNYFNQNTIFITSLAIISTLLLMLGYKVAATRRYEKGIISDKQQAIALSEMKASFLSTMSHEIRTPLTAIIGFVDHIYSKGVDAKTTEYIQNIKYASDHLLETVNDVLEFSKLESGKVKINKEPFVLQELLQNAISTYKLQAEHKKLSLSLQSSIEPSMAVNGDAFHIRQILYNLINNAIKFTETGGVILRASSRMLKEKTVELTFEVEDTGRGLSKDAIENVFKEFVQVKSELDRNVGNNMGTGLGLSITKKLITLLNGTIELKSQLGKGSKFTVTFPLELADAGFMGATPVNKVTDSTLLVGKRILLAEDSEPIRYLAQTILKEMKLDVEIARDGAEAWDLFKASNGRFDYILTDIEMPKLTGNQLAMKIRNSNSNIPIIAMTAHTSHEEYEQYKKDGVSAVITKPFKRNELNRVLTECS